MHYICMVCECCGCNHSSIFMIMFSMIPAIKVFTHIMSVHYHIIMAKGIVCYFKQCLIKKSISLIYIPLCYCGHKNEFKSVFSPNKLRRQPLLRLPQFLLMATLKLAFITYKFQVQVFICTLPFN